MKRKIGHNQIFHYHNPTGEFAIEHIEDIQPLLDSNKKAVDISNSGNRVFLLKMCRWKVKDWLLFNGLRLFFRYISLHW